MTTQTEQIIYKAADLLRTIAKRQVQVKHGLAWVDQEIPTADAKRKSALLEVRAKLQLILDDLNSSRLKLKEDLGKVGAATEFSTAEFIVNSML